MTRPTPSPLRPTATAELARPCVDLNNLRALILHNQRDGHDLPAAPAQKVYVDRDGVIVLGADGEAEDPRVLSEVHQGTFAGRTGRLRREQETVAAKLPQNTRYCVVDNVPGWLYRITSELGDEYTLYLFHDGSGYQVKVVFPEVEGRYNPHDGHLFADGRICWGAPVGVGLKTLEQAYAKSVLWASGFSVFLRTGRFPFSTNNY
jgi:hypothetical protein